MDNNKSIEGTENNYFEKRNLKQEQDVNTVNHEQKNNPQLVSHKDLSEHCDTKQQSESSLNSSPTNDDEPLNNNRIVKHIMVIGFHHKHGYQVDYCYPPLKQNGPVFTTPGNPICLPDCWKTLPLLCLPDGSHNYDNDTIYFTMPDVEQNVELINDQEQAADKSAAAAPAEGIKTIFGTACYRQIQADKLLNRTDDMTRIAVQKSVCVLSTKPLFGLIRSKLEMITHAYFEELDFSKVNILKLTYDNLNSLLSRDSVLENATFLGLSARQLVGQFGCNMLVLYKAMLLEKKILFYKSPVRDLCTTIMSMCSLFSGLLECGGLDHSTCDLQLSPTLLEALKLLTPQVTTNHVDDDNNCDQQLNITPSIRDDKVFFSPSKEEVVIIKDTTLTSRLTISNDDDDDDVTNQFKLNNQKTNPDDVDNNDLRNESQQRTQQQSHLENTGEYEVITDSEDNNITKEDDGARNDYDNQHIKDEEEEDVEEEEDSLADGSIVDDPYALKLSRLKPEDCGLPLQIFTRGSFCLPYLSISYLDLLSDSRVRSFVIGATNFLFKQKRDMYDIIVDMEENTITINNHNLKKCLSLTTEDLRFIDYLSKHVRLDNNIPKDEFDLISNDITKWVGGDEWIRYHFRLYTLYLLKASKTMTMAETFNLNFVQTWKRTTNNYKIWESTDKSSLLNGLQSRHPMSSSTKGINFNDMKLKLSYAVNNSERGRMINQTLNGIGKWSIWNNIASAATSASSSIQSAAANLQQQPQQPQTSQSTTTTTTTSSNHIKSVTDDVI